MAGVIGLVERGENPRVSLRALAADRHSTAPKQMHWGVNDDILERHMPSGNPKFG